VRPNPAAVNGEAIGKTKAGCTALRERRWRPEGAALARPTELVAIPEISAEAEKLELEPKKNKIRAEGT
jgi:hypothetical protein